MLRYIKTVRLITLPRKEKNISNAVASKVYKKLYGYENQSYYGKYRSTVPGILDEFPSIRYFNSVIIVRKEDAPEIISFLEDNKVR